MRIAIALAILSAIALSVGAFLALLWRGALEELALEVR